MHLSKKNQSLVKLTAVIFAAIISLAVVLPSAQADVLCVEKKGTSGQIKVFRKRSTCPKNWAPLNSDFTAQGPTGPQGPQGVQGPKGDAGKDGANGVTEETVITIVDNRLLDPIYYVTYELKPVQVVAGTTPVVALGYARLLESGAWETRIVMRVAQGGDTTPYLENSATVCDSGFVKASSGNYAGSQCFSRTSSGPAIAWFVAPTTGHKFPVLRALAGNAAFTAATSCGQGALDGVSTDSYNDQAALPNGTCAFGGRLTTQAVSLAGNGIPKPGSGVRFARDASTMSEICRVRGFNGYVSYGDASYDSCDDNAIIRWKDDSWDIINACSFNAGLTSLSCYKFTY